MDNQNQNGPGEHLPGDGPADDTTEAPRRTGRRHRGDGHGRGGRGGGRRGRRRGNVRAAILAVLGEGAMHGYQMLQLIEERSGGRWRPSPGSLYPTLQALEDEGLLHSTDRDGRRTYELTDTGRGELATADASAVWAEFETSGDDESGPLDDAMRALRSTIGHVQDTADPEARAATVELVESLRRSLYLVLAGERVPSRQSSATQPTSGPADWSAADEAVESVLIPDGRIETAVAASSAAGLPRIQVSSLQGRFLAILARAVAARRILEIGTLGGYSASWLAGTLPADGQLVSLELDPHHAEVALGNLTRVGLADRVDIRVGPAASALDALRVEAADPFDLVFIDADKQANGAYLTAALELARVGGLIVIDNIVRAGRSLGPNATGDGAEGTAEVLTIFATDPRIEGTIVQTVGARGWDGFAIGVVVDPEHAQDDAPRA